MSETPNAVTFTEAEKAALSGAGDNPYPEEKLELPQETPDEGNEPAAEPDKQPAEGTDSEGDKEAAEPEKPEEEDGEEEVEVVNKEGETRRKMIAFGAYEKQRKAGKAKDETIATLQQKVAYLEGLSQGVQPKVPSQQAPQELSLTPPDKTKEPEKYLQWLETAAAKALQFEQQNKQQSEQTTQFQQLNQAVMEHEQAFVNGDGEIEAHPDFYDAVKFLQDKHKAELKEAGYDAHEVQQIMAARAQSVAVKALQAGKSPAERVYSLAKLNGYKKAAPVVKETEAEKIARQAKNQEKAGKSIADMSGGEAKGGLTAETLSNMDPKEFLRMWSSGEAKKVMNWTE